MVLRKVRYNISDILLYGLPVLFFCSFLLKAILIPITHDESGACLHYSQLSVKGIIFYESPLPTNHVLNTLFLKLFINLFGTTQFICRLPTLLFSLLYLWYTIKLTKIITAEKTLRIMVLLLFIANPFVNDFFSLARGYGMAISCMMVSMYYLLRYTQEYGLNQLFISLLFTLLAVESNFTWLLYFGGLNLLLGFIFIRRVRIKEISIRILMKSILTVAAVDIVIFSLIFFPLKRMTETDQFKFWTATNFFATLISTCNDYIYTKAFFKLQAEDILFFWIMLIGFFIISGIGLFIYTKEKKLSAFTTACFLFLSIIIVNYLQYIILRTSFLTTRTAIIYHPLFAFVIGSAFCYYYKYFEKNIRNISIAVSMFLFFHVAYNYKPEYFREWWYDRNTLEVIDYLDSVRKPNEIIYLNAHWVFHPSFYFYTQSRDLSWLKLQKFHTENQRDSLWTYYYAENKEHDFMKLKYNIALGFDGNSRILYVLSDSLRSKKSNY